MVGNRLCDLSRLRPARTTSAGLPRPRRLCERECLWTPTPPAPLPLHPCYRLPTPGRTRGSLLDSSGHGVRPTLTAKSSGPASARPCGVRTQRRNGNTPPLIQDASHPQRFVATSTWRSSRGASSSTESRTPSPPRGHVMSGTGTRPDTGHQARAGRILIACPAQTCWLSLRHYPRRDAEAGSKERSHGCAPAGSGTT